MRGGQKKYPIARLTRCRGSAANPCEHWHKTIRRKNCEASLLVEPVNPIPKPVIGLATPARAGRKAASLFPGLVRHIRKALTRVRGLGERLQKVAGRFYRPANRFCRPAK